MKQSTHNTSDNTKETVLVTGGTGLIGRSLCAKLQDFGFDVAILSRQAKQDDTIKYYTWNPEIKEIEIEALETASYIVHLAGESIEKKRWTNRRKKVIVDSRVKTTDFILNKLKEINTKPKCFISSSAIGYYGAISSPHIFTESDPSATDFLGESCRQWEDSVDKFDEISVRTVKIRSGIVLSRSGGVLAKILTPVKLGMAASIASGKQYIPWIHIDDLCGIYIKAIEDQKLSGAYNAVAPEHITNKDFTNYTANAVNRKVWLPNIPAFIFRLLLGERSVLLIKGSRISSEKIIAGGFHFKFPHLKEALKDLLK